MGDAAVLELLIELGINEKYLPGAVMQACEANSILVARRLAEEYGSCSFESEAHRLSEDHLEMLRIAADPGIK